MADDVYTEQEIMDNYLKHSSSSYTKRQRIRDYMDVLHTEILLLRSRIQPEDTGHLHTTVNVLWDRLSELESMYDQTPVNEA